MIAQSSDIRTSFDQWKNQFEDYKKPTHKTDLGIDSQKLEQTKAISNFADTICCAIEAMNGEQVFECFYKAVEEHYEYTNKEYEKASVLLNLASSYLVNKVKDINLD
jgi:hypothetical protein